MKKLKTTRHAPTKARCEILEPRRLLSSAPVNPYVIDLLVVYTQQAKIERGGNANIQTLIQSAVDTTNQALYNSVVPITIRLVHSEQIDYTTSGNLETDKIRLGDPTDGFMDNIPALRNQWGADLVSLISNDAGSGGNAYIPVLNGAQNDTLAFSAIDEDSISDSNLTMAHELGHNLGAGHERDNVTQPAPGIYPYSYGYRFTGVDGIVYHDIMSYDPGLGIPYYSNPDITYDGVPEGKPASDPQSADVADTFALTAPMVAAYRPTTVADTTGPSAAITSLQPSGNLLTFTVQYKDDEAVDASSLGSNDVYVTTPEGFHLGAELLSIDRPGNAYAKIATYRVTLPASNPPISSLHIMLRANQVKDINGNYSPAAEIPTNRADHAGWDFRTTRNLGPLPSKTIMTDSLGEGDTDDIYQFTLAKTTTIETSLTGMTGDADCYFVSDKNHNGLYDPTPQFDDPANEYLGGSYNINGADRGFNITLAPGTYYLWVYLQTQTTSSTPYTLTLDSNADTTPPASTLDAPDLTTSQTSLDFAVTYSDNEAMDAASTRYNGAVDIDVHLDNGFDFTTYYYPAVAPLNPDFSQDAQQITLIYHFAYTDQDGKPIAFGPGDDGTYTVSIHPNVGTDPRPHDVAGNDIPLITLGSFHIEIGSADATAPTATAMLPPILVPGQATYDFTVAYADGGPFDDTSIDGNDIRVTGPNGFNQLATLVSPPADSAAGSIHTAAYRIAAPGGSWGFEDDGPYTVSLLANQVNDAAGNFAAGQTLGTINVHVPYPGDSSGDDTVGFADLVAVAQNYGAFGKGIATGDLNFDGAVDFSDLVLVAQHYGGTLPPPVFPAAPVAAIAKPAAVASASPAGAAVLTQKPTTTSAPPFATKPIRAAAIRPPKLAIVIQPVIGRGALPSFPAVPLATPMPIKRRDDFSDLFAR